MQLVFLVTDMIGIQEDDCFRRNSLVTILSLIVLLLLVVLIPIQ